MTALLTITRSDGRTEQRELPPGAYEIGRESGHIVLHDPNVSGAHARLEVGPSAVIITDLGSSNGTFDRSHQRLTGPTTMEIDHPIRMGSSSLTLTRFMARSGGTVLATSGVVPLPPAPAPAPVVAAANPWTTPVAPWPPAATPFASTPAPQYTGWPQPGVASVVMQGPPAMPGGAGGWQDPRRMHATKGAERLLKHGVIGGCIGALLSIIPGLGMLNLCFCMLAVIGCQVGLGLYLKENPHEQLSGGDAATLGLITGLTTGILQAIISFIVVGPLALMGANVLGGTAKAALLGFYVVSILLFSAFGALGGFLGLSILFGKRKKA